MTQVIVVEQTHTSTKDICKIIETSSKITNLCSKCIYRAVSPAPSNGRMGATSNITVAGKPALEGGPGSNTLTRVEGTR